MQALSSDGVAQHVQLESTQAACCDQPLSAAPIARQVDTDTRLDCQIGAVARSVQQASMARAPDSQMPLTAQRVHQGDMALLLATPH